MKYGLMTLALLAIPLIGHAKEWDRLPDERVIIEIKGEKLAFTTTKYDLDSIFFDLDRKIVKANGLEKRPTLREVLNHPNNYQKIFEESEGVGVRILPERKQPSKSEQPLAQGKFSPSKLASGATKGFYIWVKKANGWEGFLFNEKARPRAYCNKNLPLNSSGFYVSTQHGSTDSTYCLPSRKRSFQTPYDLKINCRDDSRKQSCTTWFYGETNNINVGYSFFEEQFPKSEWQNLNRSMHAFFSYIVLTEKLQ